MAPVVPTFCHGLGIHFLPLLLVVVSSTSLPLYGQAYDLLLKGGHVIDPGNDVDRILDVAIKEDRIVRIAADIPANEATKAINVAGLYVTPRPDRSSRPRVWLSRQHIP
jgi:dihydroorotase